MSARRQLVWGGIIGLALGLGPAAAQPSMPGVEATDEMPRLGLEDFLRRARSNSPAVDIGRAELAKYLALYDQAYYAWTPRLKVESLLAPLPERLLLRQCVLDDTFGTEGETLIGPCAGQNVQDDLRLDAESEIGIYTRTKVRLTFPIYTFGKIDAAQNAARSGVRIGEAAVDAARGQLEVLVRKAYYGTQLAASALEILKDGRDRMRKAKEQIEAELEKESGKFTSNDLRKLVVEQAELESGYLETGALSRVAWEGLRIAAGYAPGEPFGIDSKTLRAVHVETRSVDDYLELSAVTRPDLRMAVAAVRARAGQVEMALADFYPDVALVGEFTFAKGTSAEDNPDPFANDPYNSLSWGAVLALDWSLDYSARMSALRQAEATLARQQAELDLLRQKLRLDVVEQVANLERYSLELEVRETAMKAGKAWLVSNSLNFGLGLSTTDQLLSSLIAYSKARLKYFQTIYEFNLAVASLSKTVGIDLAVPPPVEP